MKNALLVAVVLIVAVAGLGLQAINVTSQDAADIPETWIDSPLNRMRIPLAPFEIVVHVSDENAASRAEISVDESVLTTLDAPAGQTLAAFRHIWSPPDVGEYRIKVRGQNQAGSWSEPVEVLVFVGSTTPTPTQTLTPEPTMTLTATAIPTNTAIPTPLPAGFVGSPSFSPQEIVFGQGCYPPSRVNMNISVNNWQNIRGVFVFYRLQNNNTGEAAEWENTYMNHSGNGSYGIELTPFASPQYESWLNRGLWGADHTGGLAVQFVIENPDGGLIRSDVYQSIFVRQCASAAPTQPVYPTTRPTAIPTLTPTRPIIK